MKILPSLFLVFLLCGSIFNARSQDKILLADSQIVTGKVLEINDSELVYKAYGRTDNVKAIIPLEKVVQVRFQNGYQEYYSEKNRSIPDVVVTNEGDIFQGRILSVNPDSLVMKFSKDPSQILKLPLDEVVFMKAGSEVSMFGFTENNNLYQKGFEDARVSYRAGYLTLVVAGITFIYPVIGIISGVAIVHSPPKNLDNLISDDNLKWNENYRKGFLDGCKKERKKRVYEGLAVAGGTYLLVALAVFIAFIGF